MFLYIHYILIIIYIVNEQKKNKHTDLSIYFPSDMINLYQFV